MKRGKSVVYSFISIGFWGLTLLGHIQTTRAEFEDVSVSAGLEIEGFPAKQAFGNPTWVDFNNDGHLDMVYPRHGYDPAVYLNTGEGGFINIFSASGLYPVGAWDHHGFAWGDYDNDGNMDLFVAEGTNSNSLDSYSQLWQGDGEGYFTNVTSEAIASSNSGRTANWADYDNDGHLDIFLQQAKRVILYWNNGNGTFSDKTQDAGLDRDSLGNFNSISGSLADYDNDGDMDLMIGGGWPLKLLSNDGAGKFSEVEFPTNNTSAVGIAWGDYDNDQDLDVFVARGTGDYYRGLVLEDSKITFSNMMFNYESPEGLNFLTTGGKVSFALYLNSKLCSPSNIFIGSDKAHPPKNPFTLEDAVGEPEFTPGVDHGFYLWKDRESDSWHLQWSTPYNRWGFYGQITLENGQQVIQAVPSYRTSWTDFTLELYRNDGDGTFTCVTQQAGVEHIGNHRGGAVWGDYDNDGDLDIYAIDTGDIAGNNPNLLYRNNGDGTFTERASDENIAASDVIGRHYGAAWGDYNNDGFLDLFLSNGNGWGYPLKSGKEALYRNLGNENHWIKAELIGVISNRSALGSTMTIAVNDQVQLRHLNGGGGEQFTQGSGPIHFGLGANRVIDRLVVKWPSGIVQEAFDIPADQIIQLIEPVSPILKGRPGYKPGSSEGVYLWKESYEGAYHLRVSGSGSPVEFKIKLLSSESLAEITSYQLESNDDLQTSDNSFFLLSRTSTWEDGVDFRLHPGARALIAIERQDVPNPKQVHVGASGNPLTPCGWILSAADLPQRPYFEPGKDLGLFLGRGVEMNTLEARWNGDGFTHRADLSLFASEQLLSVTPIGLESSDSLTQTSNAVYVSGRVSTWWDGVDVEINDIADIGVAYNQDGLFQSHRVNPPPDSPDMPNAYWLPIVTDGIPDFDPAEEAGIFLWQDKEGTWHMRVTSGGGYAHYIGTITADQASSSVTNIQLENHDRVDTTDLRHIRFDLKVWDGWQDGIDFSFPAGTNVSLNLEFPSNAEEIIRIGREKWTVSQLPVQLNGAVRDFAP